MKKITGIFIIFAIVSLTTLTACGDSPFEDCYKVTKKALKKKGYSNEQAVLIAKRKCS